MTQWLTLSRAARLIGVPRGVLQRHVREGRLPGARCADERGASPAEDA